MCALQVFPPFGDLSYPKQFLGLIVTIFKDNTQTTSQFLLMQNISAAHPSTVTTTPSISQVSSAGTIAAVVEAASSANTSSKDSAASRVTHVRTWKVLLSPATLKSFVTCDNLPVTVTLRPSFLPCCIFCKPASTINWVPASSKTATTS
eukprot:m.137792 g.137792  ORF g.137792 m.137792 type:complete len:149 (+) comp14760_c0_seq5:731-1177(+)